MIKAKLIILFLILYLPIGCGTKEQNNGKSDNMKQSCDIQTLRQQLDSLIASKNAFIAVSLQLTDPNRYLGINDSIPVHAASTMKVPVMMEVYHQVEEGRFSLDDSLQIRNEFKSIIDGSPYALDIGEDSADRLYSMIGRKESIRSLINEMITSSGNLATNLLIDLVKAEKVQKLMSALDAADMRVLRGVEDIKAFRAGKNNTTTSRALAEIFRTLYQGKMFTKAHCREMLDILLAQKFNEKIPAGLPSPVPVAHKTGSITSIDHDAGIIYPPDKAPYILVVLTKGFEDHEEAHRCIADISSVVYRWHMDFMN